jgi:hypothetical protein
VTDGVRVFVLYDGCGTADMARDQGAIRRACGRHLQAAFAAARTEATGVLYTERATLTPVDDGTTTAGLLYPAPTLASTAGERFVIVHHSNILHAPADDAAGEGDQHCPGRSCHEHDVRRAGCRSVFELLPLPHAI